MSSDPSTGRRRSDSSRSAILAATREVLEEIGFNKLSIEGVAARAGVGKATIYRWWPTKGVLAVEAFLEGVAPAISFPKTKSAQADVAAQVRKLSKLYRGKVGQIVCEMIGSGQCDTEMKTVFFDGYLKPRREAAKEVFQRGIDQGEFREGLDLDTLVDAVYGPIFYRMLTGYAAIDDRFIEDVLDMAFRGISVNDGRPTS
ncbi:TetR family transcriptional regulator [Agrobacterium vitis]|nr:TetR family transcriptional regulator [Agrobacterium vitis]